MDQGGVVKKPRRRIQKARVNLAHRKAAARAYSRPIPPPCVQSIFDHGTLMFQTHSIGRSAQIEEWVQRVARVSGQPVDWHFAGGRIMVLALGDLDAVKHAIRTCMPEHDEMFRRDLAQYGYTPDQCFPCRPAWWNEPEMAERDTAPRAFRNENGSFTLYDPLAAEIIAALTA